MLNVGKNRWHLLFYLKSGGLLMRAKYAISRWLKVK